MYLKEIFYCTLHIRKNSVGVTGQNPVLNIIRNSDGKYLKPSTGNWNTTATDISMNEIAMGLYKYALDMSLYNSNPDSYTIVYKYSYNSNALVQSEQVLFERKNRSKLV